METNKVIYYTPEPELYHFGTLGMKWGIKRNRQATMAKAYNKYNRLLAKQNKYNVKAAKLKARGKITTAMKYEGKAAKLKWKASKRVRTAQKFAAKALKIGYDTKLSRAEIGAGESGRRFIERYQREYGNQ